MYMYNWLTLLYTWNQFNIINQLYSSKNFFKEKIYFSYSNAIILNTELACTQGADSIYIRISIFCEALFGTGENVCHIGRKNKELTLMSLMKIPVWEIEPTLLG